MGNQASTRRHRELGEVTLNLNPMMDMFAVLIPALLMMSVVVEMSAVNVHAPGSKPDPVPKPPPPEPVPLGFRVLVTDDGYLVSTRDGLMPGPSGDPPSVTRPTIPLREAPTPCLRYRGTVPPPRSKNLERGSCAPSAADARRMFWVYDHPALHTLAERLKDDHPQESQVVVEGVATVDYEAIADALELLRDTVDPQGQVVPLFPEAVIGAGQF